MQPAELQKLDAVFGLASKTITWKALLEQLDLPKGTVVVGIFKPGEDLSGPGRKEGAAAGTHCLYRALGEPRWNAIRDQLLDRIAAVIAFRDDKDRIRQGIETLGELPEGVEKSLGEALDRGDFARFKGAGHLSGKAVRAMIPSLLEGATYAAAAKAAGYVHSETPDLDIEEIENPVVQRSLREAIKQVETLIHHFVARPGRIVVEMARNVGKSAQERQEIAKGLERRQLAKNRARQDMKDRLDLSEDPSDEDLRRYELLREQQGRCIYTDRPIPGQRLLAKYNEVQIDHVLPRSRSQDNSFHNQVLCYVEANQEKGQRTPWEWKGESDPQWWETFEARVRGLRIKGFKKRNLLMQTFAERQEKFVERNLNDTRYIAKALLSQLADLYDRDAARAPDRSGKRRVFARPGAITAILRRSWGLEDRGPEGSGRRPKPRARCADPGGIAERVAAEPADPGIPDVGAGEPGALGSGSRSPLAGLRQPGTSGLLGDLRVSRSEQRRGRGKGHGETIYALGLEEGRKVSFERKRVDDLTPADLDRVKDAEGGNKPIVAALGEWIGRKKPADDPPRSPKGDPIRRVVLKRERGHKAPSGLEIRGGLANNGELARVDVFGKESNDGRSKFYLVPIYRYQVMSPSHWPAPPILASVAGKPASEWLTLDFPPFRFASASTRTATSLQSSVPGKRSKATIVASTSTRQVSSFVRITTDRRAPKSLDLERCFLSGSLRSIALAGDMRCHGRRGHGTARFAHEPGGAAHPREPSFGRAAGQRRGHDFLWRIGPGSSWTRRR